MTLQEFFDKNNGKGIDFDGAYGFPLENGFQPWDDRLLKTFVINSKAHGHFNVLLDDGDYIKVKDLGKWNISVNRGTPYVQKRIKTDQVVQMARFIMGAKKGEYVDHINHNTLDNRRKNLRVCSNAANLRNGNPRKNSVTKVNGVTWDKVRGKWHSKIRVNYKHIFLGRFNRFTEAVKARKLAERKYFNV